MFNEVFASTREMLTLLWCKFCGVSDAGAIWPITRVSERLKFRELVNEPNTRTTAPNSYSHAYYQWAVILFCS